jgi:hypothetical protein
MTSYQGLSIIFLAGNVLTIRWPLMAHTKKIMFKNFFPTFHRVAKISKISLLSIALNQCFANCVSRHTTVSPENFTVSWKIKLVLIWDKGKTHSLHWIVTLIITDNNTHFFLEKMWINVGRGVPKFSYIF